MEPKSPCDKPLRFVRPDPIPFEVNFLKSQIRKLNFKNKELQEELAELKFVLECKEFALKNQEALYANAIGSIIGCPIETETIG